MSRQVALDRLEWPLTKMDPPFLFILDPVGVHARPRPLAQLEVWPDTPANTSLWFQQRDMAAILKKGLLTRSEDVIDPYLEHVGRTRRLDSHLQSCHRLSCLKNERRPHWPEVRRHWKSTTGRTPSLRCATWCGTSQGSGTRSRARCR